MKALSRESFLNGFQGKRETVAVPELGGSVTVKEMSAKERDAFESFVLSKRDSSGAIIGMRSKLIALTCINEDGSPMFNSKDIAELDNLPASVADRICDVARRLNGMGADAEQDIEGN